LNRLFAVLTDGGEYADPSSTSGATLKVAGLGIVKSTNLLWRVHETLTPASQYLDFAISLSSVCANNIGRTLYYPNVFNSSIIPVQEKLTSQDCANVDVAITGSGMDSTSDFCPNLDCDSDELNCVWSTCPASDDRIQYEVSKLN
jgi:hypothetical protein